eukprot:scaffold68922_cov32-Prasinocladus_malaysianus.AAC.1
MLETKQGSPLRLDADQVGTELPQQGGLFCTPCLHRGVLLLEQVLTEARDAVVVVHAPHALQRVGRHHVHQAVAGAVDGLRHSEEVVRGEVEELHEERLLVAEEARPRDEPRAVAVHRHAGTAGCDPPLELAGE